MKFHAASFTLRTKLIQEERRVYGRLVAFNEKKWLRVNEREERSKKLIRSKN